MSDTTQITTTFEASDAPSIIIVDGQVYLGWLVETETGFIVKDALAFGQVAEIDGRHLEAYLKAKILDTLQKPIKVGGNGVSYSTSELSETLQFEYKILSMKLEQAKLDAPRQLVAASFTKILGGK